MRIAERLASPLSHTTSVLTHKMVAAVFFLGLADSSINLLEGEHH